MLEQGRERETIPLPGWEAQQASARVKKPIPPAGIAGNGSRAGTGLCLKPCLRLLNAMGSLCERLWLFAIERNAERALGFPSFLPPFHGRTEGVGCSAALCRDTDDESCFGVLVVYVPLYLKGIPRLLR